MSDDLKIRIERLLEDIRAAKEKADGGQVVSMSELEKKVNHVCAEVIRLEAHAAHAMKPAIAQMIERLDELAESLGEYQKKLEAKA